MNWVESIRRLSHFFWFSQNSICRKAFTQIFDDTLGNCYTFNYANTTVNPKGLYQTRLAGHNRGISLSGTLSNPSLRSLHHAQIGASRASSVDRVLCHLSLHPWTRNSTEEWSTLFTEICFIRYHLPQEGFHLPISSLTNSNVAVNHQTHRWLHRIEDWSKTEFLRRWRVHH